jgi:O-antigen/teichoic acid export membrane protein
MKREAAHAPRAQADDRRLWRAFARSVLFNVQAELVANLIRVGGVIFLARALEPREIGTAGFPEAVIQRKDLSGEHQTTACYLTAACAGAVAAMLFAAAPLIERLMAMGHLGAMIRLLCVPIFVEGTSAIPNAILQRALRYDALAAADIIAEGGFVAAAVALIYLGLPRLSLPGGLGARALLRGVAIWAAARFVPRGAPSLGAARELWPFAVSVLGGQTLVILSQNADYVMVGRLLGGRALGFYGMAWDLLRFIPERLYRVVGRVTLPAFSAIQERQSELARSYRALIAMVGRMLLPAMALLAIAAPKLIVTIYGTKWMPAALPLRLLTPGLALIGLRLAIGSIYYARGFPATDIFVHGLRLIAIVAAVGLTAPLGLAAVCAAMSAVEGAVSVAGQWIVCRMIRLGALTLAAATLPGLYSAVLCSVVALAGAALAAWLAVAAWLALLVMLAPAGAAWCWRERATVRVLLGGTDLLSSAAEAMGG